MKIESFILAYGFIIFAVLISYYNNLKLEKELTFNSIRATLQLFVMGFILQFILDIRRLELLTLILISMCIVASAVSAKVGGRIPKAFWASFAGISIGSGLTIGVLCYVGTIPADARYLVPLGGMIVGNAMQAVILSLNQLIRELETRRLQIETLLALGASARQAIDEPLKQSIRAGLLPTIATLKTVGLVHLPGVMTGFIIAGGSPVLAIKYQLTVLYMIVGATGISCFTTVLLAYRKCFNQDLQLLRSFGSQLVKNSKRVKVA